MKKKLLAAAAVMGILCSGAFADLTDLAAAGGWMSVFDNNAGAQGGYLWGSGWGVADLKTVTSDDLTFELFPNINNYADTGGTDAYWSDLAGDGNKWLEATTQREHVLVAGETAASFDFNVSAFDLDSRYTLQVFIKTLDPLAGYGVSAIDSVDVTGTMGTTTLSLSSLVEGQILQVGYQMSGLNANPATDWGSVTSTMQDFQAVPEPATFGLLVISGGGLVMFRRIRRYYSA